MPIPRTPDNIQAGRYNHFQSGPDGQPGIAGFDDDGDWIAEGPDGVLGTGDEHDLNNNGIPDADEPNVDELDEFIAGPGNTVVGDDIDLDLDGDLWGDVTTEPDLAPNLFDGYDWIEAQAVAAEPNQQDAFRTSDWGNPGKQHGEDADTPLGEANSYDD